MNMELIISGRAPLVKIFKDLYGKKIEKTVAVNDNVLLANFLKKLQNSKLDSIVEKAINKIKAVSVEKPNKIKNAPK